MLLPVSTQTPTCSRRDRLQQRRPARRPGSPCGSRRPAAPCARRTTGSASRSDASGLLGERANSSAACERLVPPAAEHHRPHDRRPARLRAATTSASKRSTSALSFGGRIEPSTYIPCRLGRCAAAPRRPRRGCPSGSCTPAAPRSRQNVEERPAGRRSPSPPASGCGNEWMTHAERPGFGGSSDRPTPANSARRCAEELRGGRSCVGYPQGLQLAVPRRAVRPHEMRGRLGVAAIVSAFASQRSGRPSRSDRFARWQATATRWPLARSETGVLRRLDAVEEVAGVVAELLGGCRRCGPSIASVRGLRGPAAGTGSRPADRVAVLRRRGTWFAGGMSGVGGDREARPRDAEAALRAEELQAERRLVPGGTLAQR